jgi:hypothetical protein
MPALHAQTLATRASPASDTTIAEHYRAGWTKSAKSHDDTQWVRNMTSSVNRAARAACLALDILMVLLMLIVVLLLYALLSEHQEGSTSPSSHADVTEVWFEQDERGQLTRIEPPVDPEAITGRATLI